MRANLSLLFTRPRPPSATLLLVVLASAAAGLASAEPPAAVAGSISIKNYLPELQHLLQGAEWTGLERVSRQALSALSERQGPESADAVTASLWLAKALTEEGRYADAELLEKRALEIRQKTLGPNHPDVASSLDGLAQLYLAQGEYLKAEALSERALNIREKGLRPDDPAVAQSLNNLAEIYKAQGEYAKAEPLYQRALGIAEKALGPNGFGVAMVLHNLAALYTVEAQYEKAEPLYQRALGIEAMTLGPNHPSVAKTLNAQASLYQAQGEYAKAEPLYQRALDISEKVLGPNHPDVGTNVTDLAGLYEARGEYTKAEPLYQRALNIFQNTLGPNHPGVATNLVNLARLYSAQGQYPRAEPLYQRALGIQEKALGPDHPAVAITLNNLAALYWTQGQYSKAEPLYQRALGIREKTLGPNHPEVAVTIDNLAEIYEARGDYAKAAPLYQRALDISEKALGPNNPGVATDLNNLAELYQMQGQYAKAEPLYQRALVIMENTLGRDHQNLAIPLNNLAMLYQTQGQYATAELLYQRAVAIQEKTLGRDHPDTAATRENLAYSDVKQGRFDQATASYRLACSARSSGVRSGRRSGEAMHVVQASASKCSAFHALALWEWSAHGGGVSSADRPDALKLEAFTASQRAHQSAAGMAMARSAALTAANSAGVGPEAREYETALLELERLDGEYAEAAGLSGQRSTEKLQRLTNARDEVVSKIKQLEGVLQTKAPLYWDYRAPTPVSVAALQATDGPDSSLLRENEALIVFLVPPGSDRGLVFAVSKEKVAWARIGATGNELRAAVVRLRAEIDPAGYALSDSRGIEVEGTSPAAPQVSGAPSATRSAFDRHLAYRMHQVLLGDASIQAIIQDKSVLLFVPSGPLTALPPALLVTAAPSGGTEHDGDPAALRATAWLLRSKAVALLPAVSSLRTLRQILPVGDSGTSDPLLAFADPVFTPLGGPAPKPFAAHTPRAFKTYFRDGIPLAEAMESLPALPGTRIEAEALRRALGAPPSSLLLGRSASKAQLLARNADGRLAKVRVLEFATHGLVAGDVSNVAEPGLVLAAGSKPEDLLLLASEASTLRLKADWVLLSACNTASPDAPEAEGLSGLARAFFYAGARSLLVSHWLVRDDVAPVLIPAVLQAEHDDPRLSRAEALRKASLAVLDDPHLNAASPAAWAAFTLIGEAGRG